MHLSIKKKKKGEKEVRGGRRIRKGTRERKIPHVRRLKDPTADVTRMGKEMHG